MLVQVDIWDKQTLYFTLTFFQFSSRDDMMLVIQEQLCDELTNKSDLTLLKYPEKTAATLRLIHRLELKPDFSLTPVA